LSTYEIESSGLSDYDVAFREIALMASRSSFLRFRDFVGVAITLICAIVLLGCRNTLAAEPNPPADPFERVIAPLFVKHCLTCHNPSDAKGGLDLTSRASLLTGGDSGPAISPGAPNDSYLLDRATKGEMPPPGKGTRLTAAETAQLAKWIKDGAAWPRERTLSPFEFTTELRGGLDWWSLQPLSRPKIPTVRRNDWVRNPIDAFVLEKLEQKNLSPAADAERVVWLRRATFDLWGLPPTPEEIDAFVADTSSDAYEKAVDRLLASPHYGERWGRHWLDVVRFGESQGFEYDRIRDHAWRYRDYVIQSLNADKPYTQFIREQIAGDVLEPVTPAGMVASGMLVAGPWDQAGNKAQKSGVMRMRVHEDELEDTLSVVAQTFLGLTLNCARCHDHKFDAISQRDYYRVKAVFEGIQFGEDRPLLTPTEQQERNKQLAEANGRIRQTEARLGQLDAAVRQRAIDLRSAAKTETPTTNGSPFDLRPFARWTFDADASDSVGTLHGTLEGGAAISKGRLILNGKKALVRTVPLPREIGAKTLEVWVAPANLEQRGGGVMTLQSREGKTFDSLVFAERQPKKWLAGSDFHRRTRDLVGAPDETATPGELVHLAIVYHASHNIQVYRNGQPYGEAYAPANPSPQTFAAIESEIVFGLRHTGAGNGFFAGEVDEARLYDRALSSEEVAASFRASPTNITPAELQAAASVEQRQERAQLTEELRTQKTALQAIPPLSMTYGAASHQPEPTYLLKRGDVEQPAEQVTAGALSAVKTPSPEFSLSPEAPESLRRTRFADWLTNPDNPLTARVMVNRVWHYHFGRGIVASPNDFGFNGDRPTHPELLDWLARDFIEQGWSLKRLHRLIMLSSTYRQSSQLNPSAAEQDAENRLLWRFAPRRLEAEAVRDAMLLASGELNPAMGGPSFRPFDVRNFNANVYTITDPTGPEFNRRTVYRINVNAAKSPLLETLDCPDPTVKTPRRSVTTTPLQALGLMNNSFVLRQASKLATRVERETPAGEIRNAEQSLEWQLIRAYRLTLGRAPRPAELTAMSQLARDHGLPTACWTLLNATEFMYVE
jgi:hypothetical protein